jgi:hypothetical protein
LTGCTRRCFIDPASPACKVRPQLYIPANWAARHIQLDFERVDDYSRFFRDASIRRPNEGPGGADADRGQGLEGAHVVFYAGHGTPERFEAHLERDIDLAQTSLGDGRARYLWMVSCKLMAHGRKVPVVMPDGREFLDYAAPHRFEPMDFDPKRPVTSPEYVANAFHRWGRSYDATGKSPLNPRLRLACGGSTAIGGNPFPSAAVWQNKLIAGLDVADSFLIGLAVGPRVPLCITRGRDRPRETPLFDREFSTCVNPGGAGEYLYLGYPVRSEISLDSEGAAGTAGAWRFSRRAPQPPEPPEEFPVLAVGPGPLPKFLDDLGVPGTGEPGEFGFEELAIPEAPRRTLGLLLQSFGLAGAEIHLRRHPGSGALILQATPQPDRADLAVAPGSAAEPLELAQLLEAGLKLLAPHREDRQGEAEAAKPPIKPGLEVQALVIDQAPAEKAISLQLTKADIRRFLKCLYLRLQGVEDAALAGPGLGDNSPFREVPLLGEGNDLLFLQVCPTVWPADRPVPGVGPVDGAVGRGEVTLVYLRRTAVPGSSETARRRKAALADARTVLADEGVADAYDPEPADSRWGYQAAPLHCAQDRMYLVYQFDFLPKTDPRYEHYPLRTVEVAAHQGAEDADRAWRCDPRLPEEG